jgi:hypothetical protein
MDCIDDYQISRVCVRSAHGRVIGGAVSRSPRAADRHCGDFYPETREKSSISI